MKHIIRIKPNQKLSEGVMSYCVDNHIDSAVILSILGSLNSIELGFLKKLPGEYITKKFTGPLEIVCGTGTIGKMNGETVSHIHLVISDEKMAYGGHLVEGEIFSTAEIIIEELDEKIERCKDDYTGLNELKGK